MYDPHTKFEVSTITWYKDMKNYAKCKNSRFQPPFGGLRHKATGLRGNSYGMAHLWLNGKRIVDFQLVIIELFSLALTVDTPLSKLC